MYTLRTINNGKVGGPITNLFLGDWYSVVMRDKCTLQFNEIHEEFMGGEECQEDNRIYAYIMCDKKLPWKYTPLYLGTSYFIMTSNGSTFESFQKN